MRRRIVLLVVGMTTLVVLAFAIPLAVLIRHNVYRDAVAALQKEAGDVAIFLRSDTAAPTAAQITTYLNRLDPNRSASVQLPTGVVVGSTPPGGAEALPPTATPSGSNGTAPGDGRFPGERRGPPQTNTVSVAGGQLAQLQVFSPQGFYVVRVYAADDELHSGETGWWLLLGGAALALIAAGRRGR